LNVSLRVNTGFELRMDLLVQKSVNRL